METTCYTWQRSHHKCTRQWRQLSILATFTRFHCEIKQRNQWVWSISHFFTGKQGYKNSFYLFLLTVKRWQHLFPLEDIWEREKAFSWSTVIAIIFSPNSSESFDVFEVLAYESIRRGSMLPSHLDYPLSMEWDLIESSESPFHQLSWGA